MCICAVMKNKFYAMFVGRKPRVYTTWMECNRQVSRFPGNLHCSSLSREEVEATLMEFQRTESKAGHEATVVEPIVIVDKNMQNGVEINVKDYFLAFLVVVVIVQAYYLCK